MTKCIFIFLLIPFATAWNYQSHGEDWPGLCASGEEQSPINIDEDDTELIENRGMYVYYYGYTQTRDIVNDSNNIWVGGGNYGYIRIDDDGTDRDFYAEKIVFKMPSEHTIDDVNSEMEI